MDRFQRADQYDAETFRRLGDGKFGKRVRFHAPGVPTFRGCLRLSLIYNIYEMSRNFTQSRDGRWCATVSLRYKNRQRTGAGHHADRNIAEAFAWRNAVRQVLTRTEMEVIR